MNQEQGKVLDERDLVAGGVGNILIKMKNGG